MNTSSDETFTGPDRTGSSAPPSCVPLIPHECPAPQKNLRTETSARKHTSWHTAKREPALNRDNFFEIRYQDANHIISENYAYKTESYYTILRHELEGTRVKPSSSAVLDAYVVPICLERAHMAGIPVCEWGISQGYVPLPSVIYGLNYFADTSEYCIVQNDEAAKEAIKHITNMGKYPFCYQKRPDGATLETCVAVFGMTTGKCKKVEDLAGKVYELFGIPLVTMVTVSDGATHRLSSLSATRYTHLSPEERALLTAYLNHHEFL